MVPNVFFLYTTGPNISYYFIFKETCLYHYIRLLYILRKGLGIDRKKIERKSTHKNNQTLIINNNILLQYHQSYIRQ